MDQYTTAKKTYKSVAKEVAKELREPASVVKDKISQRIYTISHNVALELRHNRYSLMSFAGLFFGFFLAITSPIWLTLLFLNLPIIGAFYFLFFYTKVSLIHDSKN